MTVSAAPNKHQRNSARTREKILEAAEQLYGSRSIGAVSLSEITAASGQKNRNALQYHFTNREGLLQAIIDRHSQQVGELRAGYLARADAGEWAPPEAAARCLVMPIVEYIEAQPAAVNYVKIVSQMTAGNEVRGSQPSNAMGIEFQRNDALRQLLLTSMQDLPPREAQRRIFLAVGMTFHGIADIYRSSESPGSAGSLLARGPLVEQLVCALQAFFSAASRR